MNFSLSPSWLNGTYVLCGYHVTIKSNYSVADFFSINTDEEYCFQGSEADDVIKEITDIWNTSEITQDEAISQWISMHL